MLLSGRALGTRVKEHLSYMLGLVTLAIISFQIVPGLPKTRSGKIMRRILRKIESDELGDISTLANPAIVEHIINKHAAMIQA